MRTIILEPYDSSWKGEFEKIKAELLAAVSGCVIAIEHVGSTSVEGLCAKPVIDIDIVIEKGILAEIAKKLSSIGYTHVGDLGIEGREAFKYDASAKSHLMKHHLYVCEKDSAELARHIAFRDFLRANPDYRDKYGEIKREMAKKHPHDIDAYIEGKGPVVREVLSKCGL